MESVIIISFILGTVIIGLLLLYYGVTYLYEWYIENFTVDVDPDHPEREISASWGDKLPQLEKLVDRGLTFASQIPKLTEKLIRSILVGSGKKIRSITSLMSPVPARPRRPIAPPPPPPRKKARRSPTWRSSEDILRAREEILGIDPADRGRGRDYWDTRFKKEKQALKKKYSDVWDTKRR